MAKRYDILVWAHRPSVVISVSLVGAQIICNAFTYVLIKNVYIVCNPGESSTNTATITRENRILYFN